MTYLDKVHLQLSRIRDESCHPTPGLRIMAYQPGDRLPFTNVVTPTESSRPRLRDMDGVEAQCEVFRGDLPLTVYVLFPSNPDQIFRYQAVPDDEDYQIYLGISQETRGTRRLVVTNKWDFTSRDSTSGVPEATLKKMGIFK
jgi:hypothetical protein